MLERSPTWHRTWPEPHDAWLRAKVPTGISYRDMVGPFNAEFGTNRTRDALLGRAWRLGLAAKRKKAKPHCPPAPKPTRATRTPQTHPNKVRYGGDGAALRSKLKAIRKACTETVRYEPAPQIVLLSARNVPLIDLEPGECRFPTNESSDLGGHLFCGCTVLAGKPYCVPHQRLAFGEREVRR